jgi:hypothetical protein
MREPCHSKRSRKEGREVYLGGGLLTLLVIIIILILIF